MTDRFINSDHLPQVLNIFPELSVMTWNILKRCTYHEKPRNFFNNGFGIVESEYDYHVRLKKLANEIYSIISHNTAIKCIALQEIPVSLDLELFKTHLKFLLPNFDIMTNHTQGFLFDRDEITIENNTSDLIDKIGKTPHKIQSVTAKTSDGDINFINVHLCWFKSYNSRLDSIKKILQIIQNRTIILGDFNFNILDVKIPWVTKNSEINTTLCHVGDGVQTLQTCDGFLIYDR